MPGVFLVDFFAFFAKLMCGLLMYVLFFCGWLMLVLGDAVYSDAAAC